MHMNFVNKVPKEFLKELKLLICYFIFRFFNDSFQDSPKVYKNGSEFGCGKCSKRIFQRIYCSTALFWILLVFWL